MTNEEKAITGYPSIQFVAEIPLTTSGKIDYRKLEEEVEK